MPQQQIIWTALPNGRRPNGSSETLMFSVVASPRLRLDDGGTGTLQSFPDFLDWPALVQQALTGFDLFIDDDETHPVDATIVSAQPGGSDVWKALFSATTPVRSQQFQGFQEPVASYSVSGVAAHLQAGYTQLAHDAPFRSADKDTFAQSFSGFAGGPPPIVTAEAAPMRARLSQVPTLPIEELAMQHRELSAALLRNEPEMSFDEKLAGITHVAGALARAAPLSLSVPLVAETGHPTDEVAKFVAFHRRPATAPLDGVPPAPQPNDDIDFHRTLTALGEYPWLLHLLRLIIDLEVDLSRVPRSSIGALRHIRARPRFSSPVTDASTYTPVTKYILDNDTNGPLPFPVFVAAPKAAATPPDIQTQLEIVDGFLNLGLTRPPPPPTADLQFDVFTVDIDGSAKKLLNTIQLVAGDRQAAPIDATTEVAAPALLTSGLNLVRTGQADLLKADVKNAGDLDVARQAGQRTVLIAEDLVRGYRVDIRHFPPSATLGQPWLSLHQRAGNLRFKRDDASDITIPLPNDDEGFVQPVLIQYGNGGGTNPIYIHESYAHWQGWSLSAPLPADPVGLMRGQTEVPAAPAGLKQVEATVQATPGTLPRLRFGHSYQMRVRTVDLAGNGLNLERAQSVLDTLFDQGRPEVFLPISGQSLPYRRFDPIASPVLSLREELLEGEAVDVMVIRSNGPPSTTASFAESLGDVRYHGFNDRHVTPPKSSQRMAERHGRLDAAFGISGQPQSVFTIFARDLGTLNDTSIINAQTGQAENLPDVVRSDETGAQTTIPHGLRFFATDQAKSDGSGYTVHYEEQLRLPYLPDPLADGAALFNLPGLNKSESLVLVENATPGVAGTLQSRSGDQQLLPQPAIDALGPITKIGFPSAALWPDLRCFRLRLDGGLDPNGETPAWSEVNGVRTLTVRLAPAEVSTIFISTYPRHDDVALFGLHFSWSRLGAPEGERQFIETAEHGALAMLTPAQKVVLVHAVQQPLIAPQIAGTPFAPKRFPSDTLVYLAGRFKIHGKSTEKLDLLASWSEPLQESESTRSIETHVLEVPISLADPDPLGTHGDPVPIATYTRAPTDIFEFNAPPQEADARAKSFLARHEFGDTRHRRVTYRLVATTRFKEYFPGRITSDNANITRATTFENVQILNSVRPPALEITSIIPAFQWDHSRELTSQRAGGWLRVYLGAKWFATGEGEMVAIVGEAAGGDPASGADPMHATSSSSLNGTIVPTVPPVVIPGLPNIYPFETHHDGEIGLWYADIAFDVSKLYFPFVRLRLARFQQQSLDGLQLSPVVEAGFYQLAPDRTVTLTFFNVVPGQPDKHRIDITVSGPRAPAAMLPTGVHLTYSVEVAIEQRPLGGPSDQRDPLFGWVRSTTIVPTQALDAPTDGELWRGSVLVPAVADMDRRIVTKEFEIFPPNEAPPGQAWSGEAASGPSRRLVYAETIAVPGSA